MALVADRAKHGRPERLRAHLPPDPVVAVDRARWGFSTPTRILTLASGRRIVIQHAPNAAAWNAPQGWRFFREAGLPVATLVAWLPRPRATCLVWEFVEGAIGANLMDGGAATTLARQMGRLHGQIQAIRAAGVPPDPGWSSPGALRVASGVWLAAVGRRNTTPTLGAIVDRVAASGWTPSVTHGDYVPANVLVVGRRISAILDLGDVALRHPLLDAAWWSLIVEYHHGSDHGGLETAFLEGAELPTTRDQRRQLADVAAVRALQLVAAGPRRTPHEYRLLAEAVRRAVDDEPASP